MRATRLDRIRQVAVTLAEVFCILGTLYGTGPIQTSVEDSVGGALAADATLIAPAGPAFSIWTVIYLGLLGYTIWQWLPSVTASKIGRRTGWLAAISMVLNAVWLMVTQAGWIWASVVVILALAGVLGLLLRAITPTRQPGPAELLVVHGTFGLYLGWVAVASCANITAALVASGVRPTSAVQQALAVVVLAIAAVLGVWLARTLGARIGVAAAMAWGLAWIGIGRLIDPTSTVVAVTAFLAAIVVLGVAARRRSGAGVNPNPVGAH
jgi:hypothetical protein